jgi:hypothetical protein
MVEQSLLVCTILIGSVEMWCFFWYICTVKVMIHLFHQKCKEIYMTKTRWIILAVVITAGFVLGRLAVRAVLDMLLGGTLFGGNIL